MTRRPRSYALALASGLMAVALAGAGATSAAPKASASKTVAKASAAHPDFSGVWDPDWKVLFSSRSQPPPLAPAAAAARAKYAEEQKQGLHLQSTAANCVPPGLPGSMYQPYPIEFMFDSKKVVIAIEAYSQMRRIYTDGRPLPEDPDLTFQGNSVGHWEGDALVVDSVGFDPAVHYFDGVTHGPQMKIHEVMRLVGPDRLEIATTISDPGVLEKPYTMTVAYNRHRDWDIKEYICQQNNRDAADEQGRPSMKLD